VDVVSLLPVYSRFEKLQRRFSTLSTDARRKPLHYILFTQASKVALPL
jgi:hypothetical protein